MAASMPGTPLASTQPLPESPVREVFGLSPIPAGQPDLANSPPTMVAASPSGMPPHVEDAEVLATVDEAGLRAHADEEIAPGEDPAVAASVAEA